MTQKFEWSFFANYINGWMPKFAIFVPLVGYLILFNDQFTGVIEFTELTNEIEDGIVNRQVRLQLIYLGLIFLGISNFLYKIVKPKVLNFGNNISDYVNTCFDTHTYDEFQSVLDDINVEYSYTSQLEKFHDVWEEFSKDVLSFHNGEKVHHPTRLNKPGHWEDTKNHYGNFLRTILREHFFKHDRSKKGWLLFCIVLSTVGYIMLGIPSFDLFIKVILTIMKVN